LHVLESGLRYSVPLALAQKTGWFYDQCANREQWRRLIVPGARILDVCSYAGAWAITALAHGAAAALCVDAAEAALSMATRNAAANGVTLSTQRGDAFEVLDELQRAGECSTHPRSSSARRTLRADRPPIASSINARCACSSATRCW
jgi:23S rRNA (cytosine1962-C5)-methyltransferase